MNADFYGGGRPKQFDSRFLHPRPVAEAMIKTRKLVSFSLDIEDASTSTSTTGMC